MIDFIRSHWRAALVGLALAVVVALVLLLAGRSIGEAAGAAQVTGVVATAVAARRKATAAQVDDAVKRIDAVTASGSDSKTEWGDNRPLKQKASDADKLL